MGTLLKVAIPLALLFVVVGVVAILARKLGMLGSGATGKREAPGAPLSFPYRTRQGVLTAGELAFYQVLNQAVALVHGTAAGPRPFVLASVRLAEVLEVDSEKTDNSARQTALNRITSKQADFVICEATTSRPLMLVELDDKSHHRRDRAERDEWLDQACAAAGMMILHVGAAPNYDARQIAAQIQALRQQAKPPLRS